MNDTLHVVTMIANPIRWKSRVAIARAAIMDWLREPNVHVTIVEVAHGARGYDLADLGEHMRVTHVPVRAATLAWSKENCLNIGISRLPHDAKYIGTFDADIHFRKSGWAAEAIHALQLYPVAQPWKTVYDLGPKDDHLHAHVSFASGNVSKMIDCWPGCRPPPKKPCSSRKTMSCDRLFAIPQRREQTVNIDRQIRK